MLAPHSCPGSTAPAPGADYRCPVTPMSACPRCGRAFANRNQTHSCAPLGDLDRHFARAPPAVPAALDRVLAAVSRPGPVTVLPEKTRLALQVRMNFGSLLPHRHCL